MVPALAPDPAIPTASEARLSKCSRTTTLAAVNNIEPPTPKTDRDTFQHAGQGNSVGAYPVVYILMWGKHLKPLASVRDMVIQQFEVISLLQSIHKSRTLHYVHVSVHIKVSQKLCVVSLISYSSP